MIGEKCGHPTRQILQLDGEVLMIARLIDLKALTVTRHRACHKTINGGVGGIRDGKSVTPVYPAFIERIGQRTARSLPTADHRAWGGRRIADNCHRAA